ncbi:arginase family protein [Saccharomonospora viridis]|jgi:arginase|uniref:Arginase family hydrolase, arginase/agmainase/formiminoglutamate hydrolase n=1 Tax=Saccharomonospora viridis (strain ATCC 15386 / DSM 43017 / JCM 3036 / CCUG 5913 / NBRC 12207 / NCIMB 9602 / P101) TaxID=471857 RepID=C7MY36_SACVD|nr:arginase family protein [Saccharomonospora viridis]ACU95984.1 arginase family hydrolase, arginase/agmainase/formiminoglutamate hydrolase [Saccharomonospora viridis DSM 43017]
MRVHAVPQWQGAGWDGAPSRLPVGCEVLASLAEEVLGTPVSRVPVDHEGSPVERGVVNRAALLGNRPAQLMVLENPEGPVLTLGGDCASDLVPIGVARYRYGPKLGVLWFDAHADANTPDTSPSGAFHGMVLRALLGEGDEDFVADPAVEPGRAVLVGTRSFDPAETEAVRAGVLRHVPPPAEPADVVAAVRESGAERLYVHVDVDVLDPGEFSGTHYHEPGGLTVERLVACLDALAEFDVVGAALTECTAQDRTEAAALIPVVRALHRSLSRAETR